MIYFLDTFPVREEPGCGKSDRTYQQYHRYYRSIVSMARWQYKVRFSQSQVPP